MAEAKQYILPIPQRRGVMFFSLANAFAFALCASIWALVWYGEFFTGAATAIWGFLATHSGWTVGAALSPLFAALVLGYGYIRPPIARRAPQQAQAGAAAP